MNDDNPLPTADLPPLIAADRRSVWHPYTATDAWMAAEPPPVIVRAEGPFLYADDGRRFIDGVGSWWVSNLGHGHPGVRAAIERQLGEFAHVAMAGLVHPPAVELAERLCAAAPPGLSRAFYSDNGSTAVEVAVRCAFQYWQQNGAPERRLFVSLAGAYHGDTLGAVSVGGIDTFHKVFGPLLFETLRVPSPGEDWYLDAFDALERTLRERAHEVAGVIVEPLVQGAAGMLMHPPEYLTRLRALCDELDVFLIADEVFVGFGRTGTLFACEQAQVTPDFLCLSKGLSAGFLPFAATLTTERVFDGFRGGPERTFHYGHSMCGNPLGCAAALAVLDAFEDGTVLAHAAKLGERMQQWLDRMAERPGVSTTRRTGTIAAVQFGASADYGQSIGWRVYTEALARGAYLRPLGNVTYFVPALTTPLDVLDELLQIAEASIDAALAG